MCIKLFAYVREIERRGCAENGDYEKKERNGQVVLQEGDEIFA